MDGGALGSAGAGQLGSVAMRSEALLSGASAHGALRDGPSSPHVEVHVSGSHAHAPAQPEAADPTPASAQHDAQARAHEALAHSLVTLWLQPVQALQGSDDFVPVPLRA
jgi:hypothetical protein